MGLCKDDIAALIYLRKNGYLQKPGHAIEIGAQQLSDDFLTAKSALLELRREFGISEPLELRPPMQGQSGALRADAPPAKPFYEWLGFQYACIDIDKSPGAIALDLNFDSVPASERLKYDLVTNFGTTEHAANQLNSFEIIHDLTAVNGVMIHALPAQGYMTHGLFNYNPKFFWMLARSNGYRLILMNLCSEPPTDMPSDITDALAQFFDLRSGQAPEHASYRVANMGLRVILQKRWSMSFVPPLDVGADAPAGNDEIERRYWSVFRPSALHDPIERIHARNAANHDSATSRSLRNSASTSPQIALANRRLEAVLTSLDRVLVAARAHESGPMTPATRDKLLGFMSHARAIFAELGLQTTTAAMDALTAIPQDALTFSVLTRKLEQVRATVTADAAAASPNTP